MNKKLWMMSLVVAVVVLIGGSLGHAYGVRQVNQACTTMADFHSEVRLYNELNAMHTESMNIRDAANIDSTEYSAAIANLLNLEGMRRENVARLTALRTKIATSGLICPPAQLAGLLEARQSPFSVVLRGRLN